MKFQSLLIVFVGILSGCVSARFSVVGENEYRLFKLSDACAVGAPNSVLNYLREESIKFCAGRKETPVEISSNTQIGIPVIRCASAELIFRCEPVAATNQ